MESNNGSNLKRSRVSVEISCSIEGDIQTLYLIFSIDNGHSWFRAPMKKKESNYSLVIPNLSKGAKILYLFKAIGKNGEEYVENNNGHFYSQIAGDRLEKTLEDPIESGTEKKPKRNIERQEQSSLLKELESPEREEKEPTQVPPEFESRTNPFLSSSEIPDVVSKPSQRNHVDSNTQTRKISQKSSFDNENESPIKLRPIIAYNPFPADYGKIRVQKTPLYSFSKIIDAELNHPPVKNQSFIQRPKLVDSKKCIQCKAKIQKDWTICPICGKNQ